MKIAAITCTEGRPLLFSRCKIYVERQTRLPDLWLVKTSKPEDVGELPPWAKLLTWEAMGPFPNLVRTLRHVPKDHHVVIMEDDDWYGPKHIETLTDFRGGRLSAAVSQTRYNVPARKWNSKDPPYGGPGQVAIHADLVQHYADCLTDSVGDQIPWREEKIVPVHPTTSVGIKGVGFGLPGLMGKTTKHNPRSAIVEQWIADPEGRKLREWLGEDADFYLDLVPCRS